MNARTIFIGALTLLGIFFLVKVWNYYSRKYNNRIIINSKCQNCHEPLGEKSLNLAIEDWRRELEIIKRKSETGTVTLRNLKIACSKCGKIHLEKELYKRNRSNQR